jgi:hypothetical protein
VDMRTLHREDRIVKRAVPQIVFIELFQSLRLKTVFT